MVCVQEQGLRASKLATPSSAFGSRALGRLVQRFVQVVLAVEQSSVSGKDFARAVSLQERRRATLRLVSGPSALGKTVLSFVQEEFVVAPSAVPGLAIVMMLPSQKQKAHAT